MNFDDELRRTFRRTPAPDHLADKVLARIAQGPPSPQSGFGEASKPTPTYVGARARVGVVRWLAAAAAITLVAAGGARYYLYQQTVAEAERVQADIMVALQITGEKLALVQRKVEDSQR